MPAKTISGGPCGLSDEQYRAVLIAALRRIHRLCDKTDQRRQIAAEALRKVGVRGV